MASPASFTQISSVQWPTLSADLKNYSFTPSSTSNTKRKQFAADSLSSVKKIILACWIVPLLASCQTTPPSPSVINHESISMQKKEQLIAFLKRLKIALDKNILDNPKKFYEDTGFEVLEWTEANESVPSNAQDWRFNVPAMDAEIEFTKNYRNSHGVMYFPTHQNSVKGSFVIDALHTFACLSASETSNIFGEVKIAIDRRPKPFHVVEQPPFWDARAFIHNSQSGSLLTFNFQYEDEQNPKVTCLRSVGIRYGAKPPLSYQNRFNLN
jgi:hypothetical protein